MRSNSDEVEKNNDCFAIYTSPPPTAEPLLEEKPLKGLHLNLMCRNMLKVVRGDDRNVNQKQNFEIFNYKKEIMKFRKGEKR